MAVRKTSGNETTEEIIRRALIGGIFYTHDADGRRLAIPTTDQLKVAWKKCGEKLTAEHIAFCPGTRPWGWWQFSIPAGLSLPRFSWGLNEMGRIGGVPHRNRERPSDYEQLQYLECHGLLTPDEQQSIHAADDARQEG